MAVFSFKNKTYSSKFLNGNPYYVPPGFESIATVTATGGETSLSFTSIPQNYVALQIRGIAKDTYAGGDFNNDIEMRFNSDAGNNYAWHRLYGTGSSVLSQGVASSTNALISYGSVSSGTNMANIYGAFIVDIQDYAATTRYKTVRSFSGADRNAADLNFRVAASSNLWMSLSSITTITFNKTWTAWAAGTTFALYGIRGA